MSSISLATTYNTVAGHCPGNIFAGDTNLLATLANDDDIIDD
jgi:hypothetical protein